MPLHRSFVALLVVALLTACADDDRNLSPQTCQLQCERAAQCSPPADARSCRDQCAYPAEAAPPPLSSRYLDAVRRCLAGVPCSDARLPNAGEACASSAALTLKPSKAAEDLCRRAQRAEGACRVTTLAGASCLDNVKVYHDDVLRRAARCYDDACVEQPRCLEYVFGSPAPYLYP